MLTDEQRPLDFEIGFANGERVAVKMLGSGREPPSFWCVLDAFRHISGLPPGWDSYRAQPLSASAVRRCLNLLPSLLTEDAPEPMVIPTQDGGIQFEWHRGGIDVEVKVPPAGPVSYLIVDENTGEEQEWEGRFDRQAVHGAFTRMAQVT